MLMVLTGTYQISVSISTQTWRHPYSISWRSCVRGSKTLTYDYIKMIDGALVTLDLTQRFMVSEKGFKLMKVTRRIYDMGSNSSFVPVANRGYMWQDSLGNVYIGGGHFFSQPWPEDWTYWQKSQFFLEKKKIPDYSIWRFDIKGEKWNKVSFQSASPLRRLASSGYVSIPSINMSYAFGYVL